MSRRLFDPDAPWTVRAGVIFLVLANVVDLISSLLRFWSGAEPSPGLWRGVWRPVIGFAAGLAWTWGIAQMLGVCYWAWVVIMLGMAAVALVMIALSLLGLSSSFAGHEWTLVDVIGLALILVAFILMMSKPSLRAYWQHGRLFPRKAPESPNHPLQPPAGGGCAVDSSGTFARRG